MNPITRRDFLKKSIPTTCPNHFLKNQDWYIR